LPLSTLRQAATEIGGLLQLKFGKTAKAVIPFRAPHAMDSQRISPAARVETAAGRWKLEAALLPAVQPGARCCYFLN
jgi:hypothetical protein